MSQRSHQRKQYGYQEDFRESLFSNMPLPGLDSTGRGPHTENAQGGCLSRQLRISHLSSFFLSFLQTSWGKVVFKREQIRNPSENTDSRPCSAAAPHHWRAGRQQQAWQVIQNILPLAVRFYCSHQNKNRQITSVYQLQCHFIHRAHRPPAITPPTAAALHVSSYLQPGGEREWKVERENISALSAIFFHK